MSNALIKFIKAGFYLIFATPLLYQATSLYPFLTLKLTVFQILVELMLAAYLFLIIFEPRFRPQPTLLFLSFSAFIFITFLSGWWGVDWRASLWSFPERSIGTFALLHFWALFVMLTGMSREINWRRLILFSFGVSLAAALSVFWFGEVSRPGGVLGNPNFLSAYLLLNFFLGLYLWRDWPWLISAGLVLQLTAIFLAQSRGAFLGLLIGLLWIGGQWLWPSLTWLWQRIKNWPTLFLAIPVLSHPTIQARLNAWEMGWQGFKERPLLGWGWENFDKVVNKYYEPARWRQGGEIFFSKPHNVVIEYLISGGVVLLTAFLFFFGAAFYKTKNPFLRGALLAYLVPNLFSLDSFGTYLMLALILAIIDYSYPSDRWDRNSNRDKQPYYPNDRPFNKVLLLIILVSFMIAPIYFVNWRMWLADYYAARGQWPEAARRASPYRDFLIRDYTVNEGGGFNELEKVIERRPRDYFLRLAYVEAAAKLVALDEDLLGRAEAYLQEAIKISPNHLQAYYVWAKLKVKDSDREGLEKIMDQAVALNPESGDSHFFYGIFSFQLNNAEKALAELDFAKRLGREPLTAAEAKVLAGYYGDAGLYPEAIRYYRNALISDHQDWEALFKLALVYYYNNDRDKARLFFDQLLNRYPSFRETVDFKNIEPILNQLGS